MALTPGRWIAIFVVGACLIAAGVIGLQASGVFNPYWWSYDAGRGTAGAERLAQTVVVLERRDSLVAAWKRSPPRNGLQVVISSRVPFASRAPLDSIARAFWADQVKGPARAPVVLLISADSTTMYRELRIHRSPRLFTPTQTDGRTCAIVIPWRAALGDKTNGLYWHDDLTRTLARFGGLCVFIARYGQPGGAIGGWLLEQNFVPAGATLALATPARDASRTRRPRTVAGILSSGYYFSNNLALEGAACLSGKASACGEAWDTGLGLMQRDPMLPRGILQINMWFEPGPLGPGSSRFMARLERDFGPEKFARLWASDGTLDAALTEATGMNLAELTKRSLIEDYGPVDASPWPTLAEWGLHLLLAAGAIAALCVIAPRREASP